MKRKPKPMRVLTLKQPWAGLAIAGHKTVENRTWEPSVAALPDNARFAIHAGLGVDTAVEPWIAKLAAKEPLCAIHGAIIGTVEFAGIASPDRDEENISKRDGKWWNRDCFGWILRNPERITPPIFCKGKLQLWKAEV